MAVSLAPRSSTQRTNASSFIPPSSRATASWVAPTVATWVLGTISYSMGRTVPGRKVWATPPRGISRSGADPEHKCEVKGHKVPVHTLSSDRRGAAAHAIPYDDMLGEPQPDQRGSGCRA